MLSFQRCREILGANCRLDDQELERLREQLYGLADVVTNHIASNASPAKSALPSCNFSAALQLLNPEEIQDVEERAAIVEFEAGANRDDAEREAIRSASQALSSMWWFLRLIDFPVSDMIMRSLLPNC